MRWDELEERREKVMKKKGESRNGSSVEKEEMNEIRVLERKERF